MWVLVAFVVLGVVLVTGSASTDILVSDGLSAYTGDSRTAVELALRDAQTGCLDHPITRLVTRKLRVQDVCFEPGACPAVDRTRSADYRVVISKHMLFGIATGTITACGGVNCRG
jgi:hypothetical protein